VQRSAWIAGGVQPPCRFVLLTKIKATTEQINEIKERAKFTAIQREILQIFEELKAVEPVMKSEVPEDAEIHHCFLFLVEKFLVIGKFDKIKTR
jgi:hypothetical protein